MRKSKIKGSSHSIRPIESGAPKWVKASPEEVESLILEMAKKGLPPSQIGIQLRDQYGIPLSKQVTNKKITEILRSKGVAPEIPEDLFNLIKHTGSIRRHLEEQPKDMSSKRGLQLLESKIRRLTKYYVATGRLPKDWKYSPEKASILVR
ncbi:MAG: 30S ribosomal protein S15 [Candidatus Verstraetearchaeota archaeon]|nr:30S ribosomal protein S15 [Candidatus Verstraetearchaeota archaeon]